MIDGICDVRSVPNDETVFTFEVTAPNLVSEDSCNDDGVSIRFSRDGVSR